MTEHWNPYARIRKDLFGFIDVVALTGESILGIQCTTTGNQSNRVNKIIAEHLGSSVAWIKSGGRIVVWGWKKYEARENGRWWRYTETEVVLDDLSMPVAKS